MYVIKAEVAHFEEKVANFYIFSDPDPVQLFRVRIRPGQKGPDPGPQHWIQEKQTALQKIQVPFLGWLVSRAWSERV